MGRSPKRVWFFVLPRIGALNVAGPWDVLGHANDLLGRTAYELEMVGPRAPAAETRFGMQLTGIRPLPRRGARLPDVAIVAGSPVSTPLAEREQLVAWLRRHHERIPTVVSICTGAFVLGAAGVLDGRRATTHWMFLDQLRARFPAVHVVDEGIFVKDGRVWTSAGITAGIDLTLALVEEDHGHRVAMDVARRLVLFLRRSGNQAQFSSALRPAGQRAAQAARHLGVRGRAHRRAPAGRAPRARRGHERAHPQPVVPRAPRRVAG